MPQNSASVGENGRMSNGNTGNFKIPKKTSELISKKNEFHVKQNLSSYTKPDGNQLDNNKEQEPPIPPNVSASPPKISSVPVYNHGFTHSEAQAPAGKSDYFKHAEAKRAPSATPDEPLKDLTPMQTMLETFLPSAANFASLPAKLSEKFSIGTCELCKVNMLSLVQSKMHYNGKPHMKKVRSFLINECGKTDEPPLKVSKINFGRELKEDEQRECKVCKVIFNSDIHANQHYEGKKHKKAALNHERSSGGAGPDGRFGIGSGFASASDTRVSKPTSSISKQFFCEMCNVQGSSMEQYKTHLDGARHAKNLRKLNGDNPAGKAPNPVDGCDPFVNFRTPSGKFYCHYCNYNATTRKKFSLHVKTDNHTSKAKSYEAEATGFDLTEDEYISKYEDY